MPVHAVLTYALPILITAVIGLGITIASVWLSKWLFTSAIHERWLLIFGTATGCS